jgi:hypothetical protein
MKKAGGVKSMQRSTAMKGNQNASKGGARSAILGTTFGPVGAIASGMYVSANKNSTAIARHNKTATGIGLTSGALYGGLVGTSIAPGVGTAIGAGLGGALTGALMYGGAKLGQSIGKARKRR